MKYFLMSLALLVASVVLVSCSPEVTKSTAVRVAFIYIGPPGDGGWTYQHDQGRLYMESQTGIKSDTVENVPEGSDAERVLADLATNHDVIFATSFGYMDPVINVAKKFPKVVFLHATGYKVAENVGTYTGKNWEASYLAGMVAGSLTKKNILGYVGAFPIPEVIANINAYTLGAQSVNPKVKTYVVWSNTWFDPATERSAGASLIDKGADVLMAYQDSPATVQVASEKGLFAGGNDSDMNKYAPMTYTTNPVWNWGAYYTLIVKSVQAGTWKTDQYVGSMSDGLVDIAPIGEGVPQDIKNKVNAKASEIKAGKFNPFTGPILDQEGKGRITAGDTVTLSEILGMNWFVNGVQGTIPK